MKFGDLNKFYDQLLGQTPKDPRFKVSARKRQLFRGYIKEGKRGFACKAFDDELLVATLVLALRQVQFKGETDLHPVILAIPKALDAWAAEVSKDFYRAVMKQFRGDVTVAREVRKAFEHLLWEHRVLQIPEPTRWVAYGFDYTFPLPTWMEGRLVAC
jgi:hypothetical protein